MQIPADPITDVNGDLVASIDNASPETLDIEQTVGTATPAGSTTGARTEALLEGDDANDDDRNDDPYDGDDARSGSTQSFDMDGIRQSIANVADTALDAAAALIRERPLTVLASAVAVGWLLGRPKRD